MKANNPGRLCLECGFCCNGVIFADVKLQPGEDAARLRSLGLPLSGRRFRPPCAAWKDCRCQIYDERPGYCRAFDCLLLKSLQAGRVEYSEALRIVSSTKRNVQRVLRLLRELGDADEPADLRTRFLRVSRWVEMGAPTKAQAALFSDLTLAFHELDQTLRRSFYDAPPSA